MRAPVVSRSVTQLTPTTPAAPRPAAAGTADTTLPSLHSGQDAACLPQRACGGQGAEAHTGHTPTHPPHVHTHIHPRVHCLPLLHACLTSPATDPGRGAGAPGVSQRSREAMGSPLLCGHCCLSCCLCHVGPHGRRQPMASLGPSPSGPAGQDPPSTLPGGGGAWCWRRTASRPNPLFSLSPPQGSSMRAVV